MTPAELKLWERINRRAYNATPDMNAAILRAFRLIRESTTGAQLTRAIQTGQIESVLEKALMQQAMQPVRDQMRLNILQGAKFFSKDIPKVKDISFAFDSLSPKVIDAIRQLETRVITTLDESIRETVRQAVEVGLVEGKTPASIARGLRDVIGLSPSQEEAARNYRKALSGEGKNPFDYKLRDKRFDRSVKNGPLTEPQMDKMESAYRKRMIAHNAETVSRTATLDSMKLGQKLAIDDAVDKGAITGSVTKTWVGILDDREREEHIAMEGETVPFDALYSNGEDVPGETTYNCRCISRYVTA